MPAQEDGIGECDHGVGCRRRGLWSANLRPDVAGVARRRCPGDRGGPGCRQRREQALALVGDETSARAGCAGDRQRDRDEGVVGNVKTFADACLPAGLRPRR